MKIDKSFWTGVAMGYIAGLLMMFCMSFKPMVYEPPLPQADGYDYTQDNVKQAQDRLASERL